MTIIRKTLEEIVVSQEDLDLAASIADEDIDLSDIPEITPEQWAKAQVVYPEERILRSLGVDPAILAQLRDEKEPWAPLLNRILGGYLLARGKAKSLNAAPGVREDPPAPLADDD
jgi:hypothetical protein